MSKAQNTLVNGASPGLLSKGGAGYPATLLSRLGSAAPATLSALGNLSPLSLPKTALFCSARCPGSAILAAYDHAANWRDSGRCIISGFHFCGYSNLSISACAVLLIIIGNVYPNRFSFVRAKSSSACSTAS